MQNNVLVIDIETDSVNVEKANLKFFGAYSYKTKKAYILKYDNVKAIRDIIKDHKIIVGFNIKSFDIPITVRLLDDDSFDFKTVVDLYEMSAPSKTEKDYNKNKLKQMGVDIDKFSLKNIIDVLKLDKSSKGEIDYNIFKKNKWNKIEYKKIEKYLLQDLTLTTKLLEWYEKQFEPLKEYLPADDQKKFKHLTTSLSTLAYKIICNKAGLNLQWAEDSERPQNQSFSGGHHINPRWDKVVGDIVEVDFTSAYPHALMMGNLFSPKTTGWNGKDYFKLQGQYDNKQQGKIEGVLKEVFMERLKAKKSGDKIKDKAYKLIINSIYGLTGNYRFKTLYNPITASDCTSMVRTWMKKLAKTLDENGFEILYGFTDSIFVRIPKESNKEILLFVINEFIEEVKTKIPFPLDTFGMGVDAEIKFIWFVSKNCYLFVNNKNEIEYKSTLLNTNTPQVIMKVFDDYMKPRIIKELDVNFTEKELIEEIKDVLYVELELSAEEHKVNELSEYKSQTSLQYQISEKHGAGSHLLIPNTVGLGVGRNKGDKKNKPIRYCTIEEFKKNKLTIEDIDLQRLKKYLKPFIKSAQEKLK